MKQNNYSSWYERTFGNSTQFGSRKDMKKGNYGSGFWGKRFFTGDKIIEKAKLLQSIKNFVKILTGKDIPVKYSSEDDDVSFTDGKSITISGNVSEEYDPTVGLSLHESSHIVLTNFEILRQLIFESDEILDKKYLKHVGIMKDLLNIIEDRRIDDWQYKESPGYKIYYQSMYEKYFESEEINKIFESGILKGKENIQSYMTYLINMTNPIIKMNELKGLPQIWKIIDIKNIDRLGDHKKGTKNSLEMACKIFDVIEKHVTKEDMKDNEGNESKNGDPTKGGGGNPIEYDGPIKDLLKNMKPSDGKCNGRPIKLGPNALKELKELLKKQKNFLKGDVKKEKVDSKVNNKINTLIESETTEIEIKDQYDRESNEGTHKVITVNNVTMNTIKSGVYIIFSENNDYQEKDVEQGLILGTMLGRKLQTRQEERSLITPRLNSGRIDKRRLAACSYGSDDIFYTNSIDKYGDIGVHISLDLSSSMEGKKWTNTMISAIAIAKAASMTKGIRVQISLRYSDSINGGAGWSGEDEQAIVINFYDSAVDSPNKLKWFKYVNPEGCTPEGLCYEALMKKIMKPLLNKNSLFINYSDGYPGMHTMGTEEGIRITKRAIDKIKGSGVEVLAFFIDGSWGDISNFTKMYGKNASSIDVTGLIPLAKELNKKFLQMGKL